MAKHKIEEVHSVSIVGILDTDEMKIEVDEVGVFDLKTLMEKMNGECVALTVKQKNDVVE